MRILAYQRIAMLLILTTFTPNISKGANELVVTKLGKMDVASVSGLQKSDVFYITNRTTDQLIFGLYWYAKSNSHQAAVSCLPNNTVVDFGDSMACFFMGGTELFIFPGLTNVVNPSSEVQIRAACAPIFESLTTSEGFPNMKRFPREELIPWRALAPGRIPSYESLYKITNAAVTRSNVTLELQAVQGRAISFL